jgi:hypothetical protein
LSSSLRLRLRLASATVQSAGPFDSYFWHAGHFRHFSHFSAPAEGGAHVTAGGDSQGLRKSRVLGTSAPASGSAWGSTFPMLGRKAGCEGVRTDFSADLASPRHRDNGPARFKPVDCEEAPRPISYMAAFFFFSASNQKAPPLKGDCPQVVPQVAHPKPSPHHLICMAQCEHTWVLCSRVNGREPAAAAAAAAGAYDWADSEK